MVSAVLRDGSDLRVLGAEVTNFRNEAVRSHGPEEVASPIFDKKG